MKESRSGLGERWIAAAAGAFGSLDTALNVAFPDLVADFDLSVGELQWVVICFVSLSGGLLVPAGALGDRVGHGTMVRVGGLVSALAMLGCALAPDFGWFLAGRMVQGAGTATVMASAPALATLSVAAERRERAVGVFQAATAAGLAGGPVIGGLMVLLLGWRGVFWFRLPLALALVVLASRSAGLAPGRRGLAIPARPRGLGRPDRWRALARREVVVANGLTFLANGAVFATWLLVPSLLVDEIGVAVALSGLVLAVSPIGTALVAARAGPLIERVGSHRSAGAGLGLMALGMVVLATADATWSTVTVGAALAVVGAGLGLFSVPNMATAMRALPPDAQGVAGALSLMMRTLGVVTGAAWHGALFDRIEPSTGFAPAFGRVFVVAAAALGIGALVAVATPDRSGRAQRD